MTKRIQKLGADRLRALKALVAGGRIEKRRVYPFPEVYHLVRFEVVETPPKVSELCVSDLIARGLIAPSKPVDLNTPGASDTIDYVATPAGHRAAQVKGIEYEDTQDALLDEEAGKYEQRIITGMEAA